MSNKEGKLEQLEDGLIIRLQAIDLAQAENLLRCITAEIALLIPYELEDCEEVFLKAVKCQIGIDLSSEKAVELRASFCEEVKKSVVSEPRSYWMTRLIYSLLLEDSPDMSDLRETIFNAADFCNLPLRQLEQIVMRDGGG